MNRSLIVLAATVAFSSAAFAQSRSATVVTVPGRAYAPPVVAYPAPVGLSADEIRDYQEDQLDRRQEMQRDRLRMNQMAERRVLGFDNDDLDLD